MTARFEKMFHCDDDELDPFAYRLLGHIRRRCGEAGSCWAGIPSMAETTQMSRQKVRQTLIELSEKFERITIEERPGRPYLIIVKPPRTSHSTPTKNVMGTPTENDMGDRPTHLKNGRGPLSKTVGDPSRKQQGTPIKNVIRRRHTPLKKHHKDKNGGGVGELNGKNGGVDERHEFLTSIGVNVDGNKGIRLRLPEYTLDDLEQLSRHITNTRRDESKRAGAMSRAIMDGKKAPERALPPATSPPASPPQLPPIDPAKVAAGEAALEKLKRLKKAAVK